MKTQLDVAKSRLFDADALNVANIKLFSGSNRDATPNEMSEQILKALAQIESGDFEAVESFDD